MMFLYVIIGYYQQEVIFRLCVVIEVIESKRFYVLFFENYLGYLIDFVDNKYKDLINQEICLFEQCYIFWSFGEKDLCSFKVLKKSLFEVFEKL